MAKLIVMVSLIYFNAAVASEKQLKWWQTSRASSQVAVPAEQVTTDSVQIYSARTYGKKGFLADHSWLSFIQEGDSQYTVVQVVGWRAYRGGRALVVKKDLPDRMWYGNKAKLIAEISGKVASSAIAKIKQLIKSYPYQDDYTLWPGPNSNTFVAHIIRNVSELEVELPPEAIGKDYLTNSLKIIDISQSGTGVQLSLFGLLGITLGLKDGFELNLLGLTFGIDFWRPAIKLPIAGRIGVKDD